MDRDFIDDAKLPLVVRVGNYGFALSGGGYIVAGAITGVLDLILPGIFDDGVPVWLWPILILIWTPGLIGFALSFYTVARYPYLSVVTGGGKNFVLSNRWLSVMIGIVFSIVGLLFALTAMFGEANVSERLMMVYMAIECLFVGFLLHSYRPAKHHTIATFLELTFGLGIPFFPIYLPSILIGSIYCKRFLRSAGYE